MVFGVQQAPCTKQAVLQARAPPLLPLRLQRCAAMVGNKPLARPLSNAFAARVPAWRSRHGQTTATVLAVASSAFSDQDAPVPLSHDSGPSSFDWRRQWYPLAPLSYLPRDRPSPYTLLGQQLAVWYHRPSRAWQVLEDRCPHRLAPLSEGRLEPASGNLQCSYHGWELDAQGRTVRIPQADAPAQERAAAGACRGCAAAFPVREEQGLLWVWMDCSTDGAAASRARPLPLPAELRAPAGTSGAAEGALLGDWYQRDLPVSFDYLLENLLDPAHVHFAHHGVIGSRSRGTAITLKQDGPMTAQGGFQLRMAGQWGSSPGPPPSSSRSATSSGTNGSHPPGSGTKVADRSGAVSSGSGGGGGAAGTPAITHFIPPGLVQLEFPAGGANFSMLFYAVPVSAGSSRLVAGYATTALPPALRSLVQPAGPLEPVVHALQFLGDLASHEVVDGDLVHIYHQEQVARAEGGGWKRSYYMPAAADRGVVLLRRWLDDLAGGGPRYGSWRAEDPLPPPASTDKSPLAGGTALPASKPLTRRQILDRYEQHTQHCPSCRRALGTVKATRQLLQAAAATGFASAFTLALVAALLPAPALAAGPGARASAASLPLLLGTAAVVAGALAQVLGGLERRFVYVDYVHADKK